VWTDLAFTFPPTA